ncbi:hypothetical protein DM860_015451 [Cuscuta australis]|uniref:Pentacotripeptide-repeat region of PRORP domain-containing protein n=1 Tax=Cuscuta australis TaxID=267555 RepID=A0A328EAY1_9ASTE|nr:hypothetical protein DM860_015451 [Cuscuta australis]
MRVGPTFRNFECNPMTAQRLYTALKLQKSHCHSSLPTLLNQCLLFHSRTKGFSAIFQSISQILSNKHKVNSQTQKILNRALLQDKKMEVALLSAKAQIVKSSDNSYRIEILDSLVQGLCVTEPEIACSVLRYCLRIDGIMPSSSTIYLLLYRVCSLGMIDGAIQVLELMSDKRMKYPFDNFVCSFVICAFICFGKPELAVRFYDNAVNSGSLKPNVYTCTSVMSAYCRLGRISDVWSLVEVMGIDGLAPDVVFYSNWMYGYFREGRVQDALERYTKMVEGNITLDTVSYTILIDGFSKEGLVEKAVGFLYKMRKDGLNPNLVTYTAVLQGFCMKGKLDEAFSVLKLVENQGFQMDEFPYVILIDRVCREGDFHGAFELLGEMEKKGVKPGVVTYNAIINGLCKVGRTSDADDLSKGIVGDVITYSTLLHGYIREGNLMGILETRRRLEAADVCLDVVMCNVLIKGLFLMGLLEDARSVYEGMQDSGLEADVGTYSTMIYGYCKADRIDLALQIFDEFRTKYTSSAVCHNCIIHWLFKKGLVEMAVEVFIEMIERDFDLNTTSYMMVIKTIFQDKGAEGVLELVQRLGKVVHDISDPISNDALIFLCKRGASQAACNGLVELERRGSTVRSKSYYLILKALLHDGKYFLSHQILTSFIKRYGIFNLAINKIIIYFLCMGDVNHAISFLSKGSVTVGFSGAVLKALTKYGKVIDAYRLITEAGNSLPAMDAVDYTIVIDGLCKGGQVLRALHLCDFAKSKGVTLSVVTYNCIINGLCHQGFLLDAFRLFDSLEKTSIYPSDITYGTLIATLSKVGLVQDCIMLLEKMLLKNIPVNIHIYNSIISGYIKLGEVQKAVELLRDVETNGFKPDEFTVSAVINGYSHKGDMEGALSFFAEFKDKNILPDYLGFMYLIRGLCAKGRMEESRSILREMLQSEHVSNILDRVDAGTEAESVQSIISLLCEQGSIREAVNILDKIGCMHFHFERECTALNISERLNEPYARKALESIEFKNNVLERKSCSEGELETDFENDSRSDRSNIFHPENFDAYYSLIALHCSKGELSKANVLAKCIMSSS